MVNDLKHKLSKFTESFSNDIIDIESNDYYLFGTQEIDVEIIELGSNFSDEIYFTNNNHSEYIAYPTGEFPPSFNLYLL